MTPAPVRVLTQRPLVPSFTKARSETFQTTLVCPLVWLPTFCFILVKNVFVSEYVPKHIGPRYSEYFLPLPWVTSVLALPRANYVNMRVEFVDRTVDRNEVQSSGMSLMQ